MSDIINRLRDMNTRGHESIRFEAAFMIEKLCDALIPFLEVRGHVPMTAIINKKFDEHSLISVHVTKGQMLTAMSLFTALKAEAER